MIECKIGNQFVSCSSITYRDMGFGQKLLDKDVLKYELILSIDEFIIIMEEPFNEFVSESKQDDEMIGDMYDIGLLELEYPDFQKSLEQHKDFLEKLIFEYLYQKVLDGCFTERNRNKWEYAINSIGGVSLILCKL